MRSILILVIVGFLFQSCDSKCDDCSQPAPVDSLQGTVLIGAEGNFMWGNASLGLYNPQRGSFHPDVYKAINKKNVGDVLQQLRIFGDKIYCVVNNSGKVKWLNRLSLQEQGEVSGLTSPRYIEPISDSKALISDLYANKIWILNTLSGKLDGEIAVNGWTEKLIFIPGAYQIWALNKSRGKVMIISSLNLELMDSFSTGEGNMDMAFDAQNNQVWICGTGKGQENGFLKCFGLNRQLIKAWNFLPEQGPTALWLDAEKLELYYLKKDVFRMPLQSSSLPTSAWFNAGSRTLYAMYKDENGFWLSDVKDYVQASEVLILNDSASVRQSFKAGINVSSFAALR